VKHVSGRGGAGRDLQVHLFLQNDHQPRPGDCFYFLNLFLFYFILFYFFKGMEGEAGFALQTSVSLTPIPQSHPITL
jgi:hypothetical protein